MTCRHISNSERSVFRALFAAAMSFLLGLTLLAQSAAAGIPGPLVDDGGAGSSGAPTVVERSRDQHHTELLEGHKPSSSFDGGNASNYCYFCFAYH